MFTRYLVAAIGVALLAAGPTLAGEDWLLQTSEKLNAGGEVLSRPGVDTSEWYPVTVPTTVLAALVENGVYPDPYYGLNLKSIPGYREAPWLVMPEESPFRASWWYRRSIDLPENPVKPYQFLCLDGINYKANVWINGQKIADASEVRGMFRRFRFDITDHVRPGEENFIAIEIIPPGLIPDKDYDTKQVEATTGWDDHNPQPPDLNMGIWLPVRIVMEDVVSISDPYVVAELSMPDMASANLTVSGMLENNTNEVQEGVLFCAWGQSKLDTTHVQQPVTLQPRERREVILYPADHEGLRVANPKLWWPHPLGAQELYGARLHFEIDGERMGIAHTRFGIREIASYVNNEDWRVFKVNGQELLIRGGAWMTSDMMLNLSEERYDALVRYAREAGFNMLRSEGFSIRETEAFYDKCDELGVMVTQQIFGRSIPDEDLAIACVDDMLRRIRTHPSLAHLLGHDETFPTESLDQAYQALLEKYRVGRSYQPHSGTFDIRDRAETGGTRTGTRELWTYASPSHYYLRRDDGAWGFAQSGGIGGVLAARDSLRQMMPAEQLWPALGTEAWSFHTVTQGADYFAAVTDAMTASYGEARDLEDFCRKGYAMNYASARGMFEAYGRNKYGASGLTTWKYNAAWPAAMTWQYVDWYLRPTAAYYGAKKACEPLHVQYAYDDASVYIVNGLRESFEKLRVRATLLDFQMEVQNTQEGEFRVAPDGVWKAFTLDTTSDLSTTHFLRLELWDATGALRSSNFYWLSSTPDVPGKTGYRKDRIFYTEPQSRADFRLLEKLPPTEVDVSVTWEKGDETITGAVAVRNTGEHLAFGVVLSLAQSANDLEAAPVYWEDNYLSLLPGEERRLSVQTPARLFTGGAPVVRVHAWNVSHE